MKNLHKFNVLLFLLLACLWSGSFIGIKEVVNVWPPLFGAAVRVGIALISFVVLMLVMRKKVRVEREIRWKLWIIGVFAQGLPFTFLFWGERFVSPGLAGILNGTVPIWTFVFALIFMPQLTQYSLLKTLGLLIGMVGIIVIFWPLLTFEYSLNMVLGAGAILIMAMSYATGNLLNQYLFKGGLKVDFLANIFHQHCGSLTFLILVSLIFEKWPNVHYLQQSYSPWLACLYLGICATALAFVLYYHLIRVWDAIRASSVLYIVPVLTLVWDYLFFGNSPQNSEIFGVAAILLGVVFIQLASMKRFGQQKIDASLLKSPANTN